jgi:hypothetical protein
MRDFFKQLFSENSGVSMMRVMSILALTAGIGIAFYGMSKLPVDYSGISLLVSVFLSAAFGGKVLQKRIEATGAKSETEVTERPSKEGSSPKSSEG